MASPSGEDAFLAHAGARLRWRVQGPVRKAVPLVLIHGWALSLEYWDTVTPLLRSRCAILRYDRRGFGQTQGPYDPHLACDDLFALLDASGIAQACLVGMSQGARVALHAAIRAPQRVRALVLDGAPRFEAETELPLAHYRALRDRAGVAAMQDAILEHPLMQLQAGDDEASRALLQRCVRSYRGADLDGGWQPVAPPALDAIRQPTLVMSGLNDGPQRHEAATQLQGAIRGAGAVRIEGAGHLAALDRPADWARVVLDFNASL